VTAAAAPVNAAFIVAPQHRPTGDIEFMAAADLDQKPVGNEPQLRNGRIAVSREWPASLYVTFQTPDGTAACTAALIGPQVMLTAAHCVPTTGRVGFRYKNRSYATQCTQHDQYVNNQDASADFALCKVTPAFVEPPNFRYETVDTAGMAALVGTPLLLTGYGCVSDIVANGATDGKYRIGFNTVDETSASPQKRRGAPFYTGSEDNNLFTTDDPAAANLCPGDSGGPAFRRSAGGAPFTSRAIVGVNSRVFYRDATRRSYGSSLVSATGGPEFRPWASSWATTQQVSACGLAGTITKCRN
jgi:secreted trypsin-like serine protease